MPFLESTDYVHTIHIQSVGQPVGQCTVQRSMIDLLGACSLHRLKTAPQIQNFIPSKTTVTRYKNIVLGMAEQISKKHRHQVIMSSKCYRLGCHVQQVMAAKATMAGTLVMAPKSVTFQRHDHLVCVFWRFAQPFLQHYIFNVFIR